LEFRFSFWGENLVQNRAIGALAALGFPNGAESGTMILNQSNVEPLRVIVSVRVMQYPYSKATPIVNHSLV
jgi:hypothetical protein